MVKFMYKHKWSLSALAAAFLLFCFYKAGIIWFPHGLYRWVCLPCMRALQHISDCVDFSLTEWVIGAFVLSVAVMIIFFVCKAVRHKSLAFIADMAFVLCAAAIAVYSGYCLLWGVTYYQPSLRQNAGIERREHSIQQLYELTCQYALACNESRTEIDKQAAMDVNAAILAPLADEFGLAVDTEYSVKPLVFSKAVSYMGFTGFYFPFTGECNVNTDIPAVSLPATAVHELAHRAGAAAEDEANLMAILACTQSGNKDFVYSGNMMAFSYLHSALYSNDKELWEQAIGLLDREVALDIVARGEYWEQFESPIEDAWSATYDQFLQSFDQKDGIATYDNVVGLLLDMEYN